MGISNCSARTSSSKTRPDKLHKVVVEIEVKAVCKVVMEMWEKVNVTDGMLCAGGGAGRDGCEGDSGGPLTVDFGGQHVLAGVVSWGIGCGQVGHYGVYADIAFFRNWIDKNIQDNGGHVDCQDS
eukprot:TRINITY_DN6759_c0_g1_i1.p1 TRINITY_DN6759_c0_g1~~TRINITY_DN6759_c0_g1_i1.p1  ORF type:complete len:125 (-),score=31.94 TRINITY_DN6759_c0_g1_i1:171-545(-)